MDLTGIYICIYELGFFFARILSRWIKNDFD